MKNDFYIRVRHVLNTNLNDHKFVISARFNESNSSLLFPETEVTSVNKIVVPEDHVNPFNISSRITFDSIEPTLPGVVGKL